MQQQQQQQFCSLLPGTRSNNNGNLMYRPASVDVRAINDFFSTGTTNNPMDQQQHEKTLFPVSPAANIQHTVYSGSPSMSV
jgi:hypothetical protein